MTYKPRIEQKRILDHAFELVKSVPYRVTARWLFYKLLQGGAYPDKDSYKSKFLPLLSKARKCFYDGWRPNTLSDDTREPIIRGDGQWSEEHWLKAIGRATCELDKWRHQDHYIELWFEAKAMIGQFEYYTKHITLRPFGGDPSIQFKWSIAKELEEVWQSYELPITVIYCGDLDRKGMTIPTSAVKDIRRWCQCDFQFIRAGLNPGDEIKHDIMENPEKPGTYQWEALSDEAARGIITNACGQFINHGYFSEIEVLEQEATRRFQTNWKNFVRRMDNDHAE